MRSSGNDIPEFLDAERTFHLALLRLNGNDELVEIVEHHHTGAACTV